MQKVLKTNGFVMIRVPPIDRVAKTLENQYVSIHLLILNMILLMNQVTFGGAAKRTFVDFFSGRTHFLSGLNLSF